ncbi:MAG: hypothetical protein FJZ86_02210 [Chloroflexi bacterium]|nr:hypothetical protein [Chloroflexota bacterium]
MRTGRRESQGHPQRGGSRTRGDRSQAGLDDAARIQPFADFVFHRREFGRAQRRFRDWMDREQGEGHDFLHEATQVKNIWVPTGE